ncbi:MAG: GAF domain-containing protein [Erysipelotrichaceae bacterium]|nr:GAF domain-containing protein [Erysipelotrichaceae bacterium]
MELISQQYQSLIDDCDDLITLYSNTSAFIMQSFPNISWVGFYLNKYGHLQLGPFQGKVACEKIAYDRGVCGKSFNQRKTLNVPDVHSFDDHIACDSATNSELVIPIYVKGKGIGVLDLDSLEFDRFDTTIQEALENIVTIMVKRMAMFQ